VGERVWGFFPYTNYHKVAAGKVTGTSFSDVENTVQFMHLFTASLIRLQRTRCMIPLAKIKIACCAVYS
jgi:hypothetical protein